MQRRAFLLGSSAFGLCAQALGQPASGTLGMQADQYGPGGAIGGYGAGASGGGGPGGNVGGPSLDLNFTAGPDARVTTTRAAGGATYFDSTGTLQLASANTQRIDYGPSPGGVTNWIKNSTNVGAALASSTGGTGLPTNWALSANNGLTTTIVAFGIDNSLGIALPYIDLQFSGTTTGTFYVTRFDTNIPNPVTQNWVHSAYTKLVAGSLTNVTGQTIGSTGATFTINTSGTLTRGSATASLAGAITPQIVLSFASGVAIDITVRIAGVQLQTGTVATTFIPTSTAPVNVGAIPLGLLVEEARTNSIRNPRCEGAVAGTPGTMPTNWSAAAGVSGITTSVVGVGTESGIPYIDMRFNGTAASSAQIYFALDAAITASASSLWAQSVYLRLLAGTLAGVSAIGIQTNGTPTNDIVLASLTPTSAALASQRASAVHTLSGSDTAIQPYMVLSFTASVGADVTIRIGAPQLELGAFATSPILPAVSSPAATARAADVPVYTTSMFNTGAGTLAVDAFAVQNTASGTNTLWVQVDDGSTNNRIGFLTPSASANIRTLGAAGGVVSLNGGDTTTGTRPVAFKAAVAIGAGSGQSYVNGAVANSAVAATYPTGLTELLLGTGGVTQVNGYIRRVRFWPRALSSGELQQATT